MTNICAGSQRWFDVRKRRVQSLRPSPSACCATRSSLCRSDDKPLWLVSTGPFLCSRVVVSSVEARVAFAQWPQVSFTPRPCQCETRARRSDRCGTPHAAQSAIHVACHAGGSIAIPTTTSSPCSAFATFPPAATQRKSLEADNGDGPLT